jgi:hypothetical protein
MKKEVSPGIIIGAAVGLVAIIVLAIFFSVKNDPASQAPHPPPRFDPAAKAAESRMDPRMNRSPLGTAPAAPR